MTDPTLNTEASTTTASHPGSLTPVKEQNSGDELKKRASEHLSKAATFVFGGGKMSAGSEKNLCILIHLAGCFFWFMPPLILWLWKRDASEAVDANGKEAVNFQLSFFVLTVFLAFISFGFLGFVAYFTSIILAVIGAANAGQGKVYRYPLTWRVIK